MLESVRAWHPDVPGVREVLHATFGDHVYPAHTHDAWTVLLIDEGAVRFDLDRGEHVAPPSSLSILPPHVPHDGRSAVAGRSFRKRVLYLESDWLPAAAADGAARHPAAGPGAATIARSVHAALAQPGEDLAAETWVLVLRERIASALRAAPRPAARDDPLARRLRVLLDDALPEVPTIADCARMLDTHPSHLVRSFSRAYGLPPHRYVTGRRIDLARRLMLTGARAADAAVQAGFHDQAHLTRHFRRILGTTPAAFAA
jgi:AraC-like DNA-binding protein